MHLMRFPRCCTEGGGQESGGSLSIDGKIVG